MSVWIITKLTVREAQRRRLIWVALGLGVVFVALYAIGFHFIWGEASQDMGGFSLIQSQVFTNFFLTAGLYVVNFLAVMMAVLTSVGTVSGEISSHTVQALATKPIKRWEILIGKWLGYAGMLAIFVLALGAGIVLVIWRTSGFLPAGWMVTLFYLVLESWIVLSVSLLGGTFLSTIANGVVAFMLYGMAFIGGWVEQLGSLLGSHAAVNVGIVTSLIMPCEAMWRRGSYLMQPSVIRGLPSNPFSTASAPSAAMVVYAALYMAAAVGAALWVFNRRDI